MTPGCKGCEFAHSQMRRDALCWHCYHRAHDEVSSAIVDLALYPFRVAKAAFIVWRAFIE